MGAGEGMLAVEAGVVGRGVFRRPVRLQHLGRGGVEGSPDNLLDTSGMKVDAWSEARHFVRRCMSSGRRGRAFGGDAG